MNDFTMSKFASKEDLYKAKAEYYELQVEKLEERLLNSFQLVKNGVKIGHLKFDEYCLMLDQDINHDGKMGKAGN